ncbi:MAG: Flavin reductase like domain protein [Paucimonas sp.]|nr:Flavin reductase like domain protein [Paucimonas sp.]
MFFQPGVTSSGLPYNPFKSCCVPRPIGWISTVSNEGVHNLAPYSQFQNITWDPPTIMIAVNYRRDGTLKDTAANILANGEFVWNMATYDLRQWVVSSSQEMPPGVDEFQALDIPTLESKLLRPRRVAGSPVHFECKLTQQLEVPGNTPEAGAIVFIGQVVGIHIKEEFIDANGMLDILKVKPLARIGYLDYITVESKFEVVSPSFAGLDKVAAMVETAPGQESVK